MKATWRRLILALYTVLTIAVMVHMGEPDSLSWWLWGLPLLLWSIAPVALLSLRRRSSLASGIGAAISAAFGAASYIYMAWISPADAQGGLLFLFLPIFQFAFALVWFGLTAIFDRMRAK